MINIGKDAHQGQRCFIIASGPSVEGMDLSWLKNEITICVNQSYQLLKGFEPTYICISDENLWPHMREIYSKMNTKVIASFADTQKFIDDYPGDNIEVMFKNLLWDRSPKKTYHFNLPEGLYTSKNVVPAVAIPFAQWAGFKEVYLVGCNCNNKGYAYEGGFRQKDQLFIDYAMQYYKLISELKCKTTIYNATIGGNLMYFPRVNFEDIRRKMMVVGYYTLNGDYKSHAKAMKKSVERFGIPCEVVAKRSVGSPGMDTKLRWALNANICPFFMKEMRLKYPGYDLFYLDVDATMVEKPRIFLDQPRNYDFGAVFINNPAGFNQLCGGGLYFAATKEANELLDRWIEVQTWRNKELKEGIYRLPCILPQDQEILQTTLLTIPDLRWVSLPPEYGYIEPRGGRKKVNVMPAVKEPVIIHHQASRINRGKIKCPK